MTAKEFLKLGKKDFENGAVIDEIYRALQEKDRLEMKLLYLRTETHKIVDIIKNHLGKV